VDAIPKEDNFYPVALSCGGNHSAVVMNNGELFTWGQGYYGATGLGTQQNTFAPIKVTTKNKEPFYVQSVSCGRRHTMAIMQSGEVQVTGDN
jgi:alpha-tubulin suppressor-like RCC1 family protein